MAKVFSNCLCCGSTLNLHVGCLHRINFRNIQVICNIHRASTDCLFSRVGCGSDPKRISKSIDRCERVTERAKVL